MNFCKLEIDYFKEEQELEAAAVKVNCLYLAAASAVILENEKQEEEDEPRRRKNYMCGWEIGYCTEKTMTFVTF